MNHIRRLARRYKNSSAPMFVYCFNTAMGLNAPFAFLATYLTRVGISSAEMSIIIALRTVASIIGQFAWGQIADRSKTVNRILMLLMVGATGAAVSFFFARGFWMILLSIMLFNLFYSAIYPLMDTISLDMVAKGEIGGYGNIRVMTSLGYCISVAITGVLSDMNPSYMFIMIFGFGAIASVSLINVSKTAGHHTKGVRFNSFKFFTQWHILLLILVYLVLQFVYAFSDVIFPVYLSINLGAGDKAYGYAMAIRVAGEFAFLPFLKKIERKLPLKSGIVIFMLMSTLRFGICALTTNVAILTAVSFIAGLGNIGAFTYVMTYLNKYAPPEGKATIQSHFWMLFSGIAVAGSLMTSVFMPDSAVGVSRWFFLIPGAMMAGAALLYAVLPTRATPPPQDDLPAPSPAEKTEE